MLLKVCQVLPAQPGAVWGPALEATTAAWLGTCGSEGRGLWFPQLGQSVLNKLNKVCEGKKAQKKNCKKTQLVPPIVRCSRDCG